MKKINPSPLFLQSPNLRTSNPGFNRASPPFITQMQGINPGLNPGFGVLRCGPRWACYLHCSTWSVQYTVVGRWWNLPPWGWSAGELRECCGAYLKCVVCHQQSPRFLIFVYSHFQFYRGGGWAGGVAPPSESEPGVLLPDNLVANPL
jgi:hypothetical protein